MNWIQMWDGVAAMAAGGVAAMLVYGTLLGLERLLTGDGATLASRP